MAVISGAPIAMCALASAGPISVNRMVPSSAEVRKIPSKNPASPTRLTMNAFFPASDADFFLNQNPISR